MKNKKLKNNGEAKTLVGEAKQLSEEAIKNVNGGVKVKVKNDSSRTKTVVDFFFKIFH